jgi:hypothetical protein
MPGAYLLPISIPYLAHRCGNGLPAQDNVVPALKLADDQVRDIQKFPFEKPLTDIVAGYK